MKINKTWYHPSGDGSSARGLDGWANKRSGTVTGTRVGGRAWPWAVAVELFSPHYNACPATEKAYSPFPRSLLIPRRRIIAGSSPRVSRRCAVCFLLDWAGALGQWWGGGCSSSLPGKAEPAGEKVAVGWEMGVTQAAGKCVLGGGHGMNKGTGH